MSRDNEGTGSRTTASTWELRGGEDGDIIEAIIEESVTRIYTTLVVCKSAKKSDLRFNAISARECSETSARCSTLSYFISSLVVHQAGFIFVKLDVLGLFAFSCETVCLSVSDCLWSPTISTCRLPANLRLRPMEYEICLPETVVWAQVVLCLTSDVCCLLSAVCRLLSKCCLPSAVCFLLSAS
jgi:hypothetical protein